MTGLTSAEVRARQQNGQSNDVYPVGMDRAKLEQWFADFAASASSTNKTTEAVLGWRQGTKRKVVDEVAFSSARKWSALAIDDPAAPMKGVYVLGALEMLQQYFAADSAAVKQLQSWSNEGLRVLVFAYNGEVTTLHGADGQGALPPLKLLGMVLLGDSFEVMPKAVTEGQRIVASIQNILKTFMVTVFAMLLLVVAIGILQLGFPFTAAQNTMMSFFARGAPPAILSLTAVAVLNRTRLSSNIIHFTLPAAILLFVFGLLVYTGGFFIAQRGLAQIELTPEMVGMIERTARAAAGSMTQAQLEQTAIHYTAQTALVTFFVLTGVLLMLFAEPPIRWFAGGSPYRGNWLVVAAAGALIVGYYIILLAPRLREFFELVPLPWQYHAFIVTATVLWVLLQRWSYRKTWLERFLDMPVVDVAAPQVQA